MSEGIKKYVAISGTILLLLLNLGLCWLFNFKWMIVFMFTYMIALANGMLIFGVMNYDE